MSASFELGDVAVFTTGTVGPPGQRVFYLQARGPLGTVSLRLEKQQVRALAEYLAGILEDLPAPTDRPAPAELELEQPVEAAWTVGTLAVAVDENDDRLLLVVQELVPEPDEEDIAAEAVEGATARFHLRPGQIAAFIDRAREVVAAGRPPCRLCGRPLDPEGGHICPRTNGHGTH